MKPLQIVTDWICLLPSNSHRRLHKHPGQIPAQTIVIKPVSHHKTVGNFKTHMVYVHIKLRGIGFAKQRYGADGSRIVLLQLAEEIMQGTAGIYDVFHHDEVTAGEVVREAYDGLYVAGGLLSAVRRQFYKIDFTGVGEVGLTSPEYSTCFSFINTIGRE